MYYTESGTIVRNPDAYASTGAPMYNSRGENVNRPTYIYKLSLVNGKHYVGKTTDMKRRMEQHFNGQGAQVTQKFAPLSAKIVDECPGYFADDLEQDVTEENIKKYGYDNVRGGKYTNSQTLSRTLTNIRCFKCGTEGHYANQCRKSYS